MKILCISDQIDPLIYNQNVKEIFPDIDLILCAGDLPMDYVDFVVSVFNKPTYFVFGNHNLKEYHYYVPPKGVSAFHVKPSDTSHAHGATYIGFKTFTDHNLSYIDPKTGKKTPLLIMGIPGCKKYNKGLCQFTEEQMKFKLATMIPALILNKIRYGRYIDILLTHASPRHIHDKEDPCHIGFECFNPFIQKYKPALMVHGHIHLYDMREERIGKYGDTTILNAYAHHILEFPIKTTENQTEDLENDEGSTI